jgi:hypothetical protein
MDGFHRQRSRILLGASNSLAKAKRQRFLWMLSSPRSHYYRILSPLAGLQKNEKTLRQSDDSDSSSKTRKNGRAVM